MAPISSRPARRAARLVLAPAILLVAFARPLPARAGDVYFNDFQAAAGPEWSSTVIAATPLPADGSRRFLGRFDNQTVTLTLVDRSPHTTVTLSFDFYANGTWDGVDGSGLGYGPDWWTVSVVGGPTLLNTTFSNVTSPPFGIPFLQSYPDAWGVATHPQFTGAIEQRTLGYMFSGYDVSAVYHMSFTVPHTDTTVAFAFSGLMNTGYPGAHDIEEESWGLDNVRVTDNGPVGVPDGLPAGLALEPVRPNPLAGSPLTIGFALPAAAPAQLELVDAAGRRVAGREVGSLGAGRHAVRLGDGGRIGRGVYLVRLTQGGRTLVRKVAVAP